MTSHRQDDSRITEQAAEWLSTIEGGGPAERAAFSAWIKESPRHVGELLMVKAMCEEFAGHDLSHLLEGDESISNTENVVPLHGNVAAPRQQRRQRLVAAIAAIAVAAAIAASLLFTNLRWQTYATEIGEQRGVELADGSLVHLNTQSRLKVHFSETAREIELTSGEALFDVVRNPSRPFRVHVGATFIQAIGTQFNVYRRSASVRVSVIEGSVRIPDQNVLTKGQSADLALNGKIMRVAPMHAEKVVAWREQRLVFLEDRLGDIVTEFNRYNPAPQFRVEGEALADRQLTGVFDTNAPESFVRFLGGVADLRVVRNGDEVVIRQRE